MTFQAKNITKLDKYLKKLSKRPKPHPDGNRALRRRKECKNSA